MARANTPVTYACGSCNEFGHNKRTCPALGLLAKVKPVKKPRAKKVVEPAPEAPADAGNMDNFLPPLEDAPAK